MLATHTENDIIGVEAYIHSNLTILIFFPQTPIQFKLKAFTLPYF